MHFSGAKQSQKVTYGKQEFCFFPFVHFGAQNKNCILSPKINHFYLNNGYP
jgi:hypothetical protein